jgi:hypothetical protein
VTAGSYFDYCLLSLLSFIMPVYVSFIILLNIFELFVMNSYC